jgi:Tol biopolymer transport system component
MKIHTAVFGLGLIVSLSTSFAAEPPGNEARLLGNIRQLTFDGKRSGEGYFSTDGGHLIFQSEREPDNPFYQIYLLNLSTGDTRRLSTGTGKTTCAFFRPKSDEVLFASTHLDAEAKAKQKTELDFRATGKARRYAWDYDERMDIFSCRRDGSGLKRLTDAPGYDAEASYSPDGSKIVFCSIRSAYPEEKLNPPDRQKLKLDPSYFAEIYLMNADGSNVRQLTKTPGYDGGPFFSPDGQRILWRRFSEKGDTADIYTMTLGGSDVRRLTDFGAVSWAPYFHPTASYVVFAANKLGFANFEIYLVDPAGMKEPVRVTFTDGFDGLPVFSPDGNKLCWTSNRTEENKSQLFLADWNHEAALAALKAAPLRISLPVTAATNLPATTQTNSVTPPSAKLSPEIRAGDLRRHVDLLASEKLEGRMTGTRGIGLAADYIVARLKESGLQPAGESNSWFHAYDFTAASAIITNKTACAALAPDGKETAFELGRDFRPLSFSASQSFEGEVVFGGYGLAIARGHEVADPFGGVNVSNKIVLVLRYWPPTKDEKLAGERRNAAGLIQKAQAAKQRGAKALLVVAGPASENAGRLAPFDLGNGNAGIPVATLTGEAAAKLLAPSGKTLQQLQAAADEGATNSVPSFALKDVKVRMAVELKREKKTDRNVLALLPPGRKAATNEYVMLGAHYDHLGRRLVPPPQGKAGPDTESIHFGADDNASGTALVLELAAALAKERIKNPDAFPRGVIFSFWSGEEIGLLGSAKFAEKPLLPLTNIIAYLNFDMVGRLRNNKLILQGLGSSPGWKRLIEKCNVAAGFSLTLQDDPFQPTDTASLYPKGIPVLALFTGLHDQYHKPTDTALTLEYEGAERIGKFAQHLTLDLVQISERLAYAKIERGGGNRGQREGLRAYIGTIPDYAGDDTKGLRLSDVRPGGPAAKGGLKGGDVIIEFNGKKVENITDYTAAIDGVKIGQPVKVVVQREGKRVELSVTPEARN